MAIETINTFSGTDTASKLYINFDWTITIKRDTSDGSYWIYFGDVIAYASSSSIISGMLFYSTANSSHITITRNTGTTGTIYDQTVTFSSNIESYKGKYARRGAAPSPMYLTASEVNAWNRYTVSYFGTPYKLVSGKATVDSVSISTGSTFYLPHKLNITAPQTVTLNAVNAFTVNYTPPSGLSSYYLTLKSQSGAFGASYARTSDLYISSSSKLTTLANSISTLYWYPNVNDAQSGDFSGGVGNYKLQILSYETSILDFGKYSVFIGEITGQIAYNETPPAAAVTALTGSVSVTETGSYTGILSHYGKYINSISKLNLSSSASSSFGYGTTVTASRYLNGVYTSSTSKSNYDPPVGAGSWGITVTDNHNATKTQTISWDTYAYSAPQLTQTTIHRCRQDGTHDDSGGYVLIEWGTSVSPIGNQNSKTLTIEQPEGTSTITPVTYDATGSLIVEADTEQSYNIVYALVDDFKSVTKTVRLSTAYVLIDVYRTGRGIALGKVCERDEKFEIGADLLTIMHTPGGQMIDVRASLIAGSVVYYTDPT